MLGGANFEIGKGGRGVMGPARRDREAVLCEIAAVTLSGTANTIESNFRTCLIQTGANCCFRFDARGNGGG